MGGGDDSLPAPIYGVLAIGVSRRAHEFGIRLALGASRTNVLLLVMRQGMRLAVAGAALGIGAALALTRYLDALLFNVQPTQPRIFPAVVMVLMAAALAACLVPARRATSGTPLEAIRAR